MINDRKIRKLNYFIILLLMITLLFTSKKVKMLTLEEVEKGTIVVTELEHINQGYHYNVSKQVFGKNNEYLIIGSCNTLDKDNDEYTFPFVSYYQNDELRWFKFIKLYSYGEFVDAIVKDKQIILLGNTNKNTILMEFDLEGEIIRHKKYNTLINAKNVYEEANGYFIVSEKYENQNKYACVSLVNARFDIINDVNIGNDDINILIDSCKNNESIFVRVKVSSSGYFDYLPSHPYIIAEVSERLDVTDDILLDKSIKEEAKMMYINNLSFIQKTTDEITISSYDNLNYLGSDRLLKLTINNIYDYFISYENGKYAISLLYNDEKISNKVYLLNDNKEIEEIFTLNERYDYAIKQVNYYQGFIYELGIVPIYDLNNILLNRISYIIIRNNNCFINGTLIECINSFDDKDVFGYYDGTRKYQVNNVLYEVVGDYYIPLEINIVDGSSYIKGFILTFNGEGYLNNEKIDSGYIINECGSYVIKVVGNKDTKVLSFQIVDDVVKECESENEEVKITEIINIIENTSEKVNLVTTQEEKSKIPVGMIFIVSIISIFTIILIPWRHKDA